MLFRGDAMFFPESNNINDYIKSDEIIDYGQKIIIDKCREVVRNTKNEYDLIKTVFEFVRDKIHHSADIGEQRVTCKASEVLKFGHGNCCGKSHLLAAMLRYFGIPTGFCYQKLCSDEDINHKVLHGLNAVYLKEFHKWVRLDARGNKEGIDAQFSIDEEKIAWPIKKEFGEEDNPIIYKNPNSTVIEVLTHSKNRDEIHLRWGLGLTELFADHS